MMTHEVLPPSFAGAAPPEVERGYPGDIDLRRTVANLWAARRVFGLCVVLCLLAGLAVLRFSPPTYTASLTISPVQEGRSGGAGQSVLSALPFALGGSRGGGERFEQFRILLASPALAEELDKRYGLKKILFRKFWDAGKQVWRKPDNILMTIRDGLQLILPLPDWTPPDAYELAKYLEKKFKIEMIPTTGMWRISYEHIDRDQSIAILRSVYFTADSMLRDRERTRINTRLRYLNERLDRVTVGEHRVALVNLISEQEKSLMLLHDDLPFAADIISAPSAPERPEGAKLALTLILSVASGVFLGFLAVGARALWRRPV